MIEAQVDRSRDGGEHGQHLRKESAAEIARHEPDEEDGDAARKRREESQRDQGVAEKEPLNGKQEDGERRLVDVSKGELIGAGEVVELVAEVTVPRTRDEVDADFGECECEKDGSSRSIPLGQQILRLTARLQDRSPGASPLPLSVSVKDSRLFHDPANFSRAAT